MSEVERRELVHRVVEGCWWFLWEMKISLRGMLVSYQLTIFRRLRFAAYVACTALIHGRLGKHRRKQLPDCIVNKIRMTYPSDNYTGFVNK